jgi:hypothetical protein
MVSTAHFRACQPVRPKRELRAKLLTTALGIAFSDDDRLLIEHTLLVTVAEITWSPTLAAVEPARRQAGDREFRATGLRWPGSGRPGWRSQPVSS